MYKCGPRIGEANTGELRVQATLNYITLYFIQSKRTETEEEDKDA